MCFDFECFAVIQIQKGVFSAGSQGRSGGSKEALMHGTEDLLSQQSYQLFQVEVRGYKHASSALPQVSCHNSCLFPFVSVQQLLP